MAKGPANREGLFEDWKRFCFVLREIASGNNGPALAGKAICFVDGRPGCPAASAVRAARLVNTAVETAAGMATTVAAPARENTAALGPVRRTKFARSADHNKKSPGDRWPGLSSMPVDAGPWSGLASEPQIT